MTAWILGEDLEIGRLRESNDLIGNREALDEAWNRDGYLFFRNVLDQEAVARLRQAYVDELEALDIVEPSNATIRYNGNSMDDLPRFPRGIQALFDKAPWRKFVAEPKIDAFIQQLLGDKPYWVPVVGYRVAPPEDSLENDRFTYVHQDGFFNPGIPFVNCWIPLTDVDDKVGGIAVAEGCHKANFHDWDNPPRFTVPVGAIPRDAWRRADYHPGDLLMLHLDVPHSGISNVSGDRFRLSLDIRMLPASGEVPAIGRVVEIDSSRVVIKDFEDHLLTFDIDEKTYCRALGPDRLTPDQIPVHIKPGNEIIVAGEGRHASVVRPASY